MWPHRSPLMETIVLNSCGDQIGTAQFSINLHIALYAVRNVPLSFPEALPANKHVIHLLQLVTCVVGVRSDGHQWTECEAETIPLSFTFTSFVHAIMGIAVDCVPVMTQHFQSKWCQVVRAQCFRQAYSAYFTSSWMNAMSAVFFVLAQFLNVCLMCLSGRQDVPLLGSIWY